ncbi:MAG: hypothetical protein V1839_03190 [archaeon]
MKHEEKKRLARAFNEISTRVDKTYTLIDRLEGKIAQPLDDILKDVLDSELTANAYKKPDFKELLIGYDGHIGGFLKYDTIPVMTAQAHEDEEKSINLRFRQHVYKRIGIPKKYIDDLKFSFKDI